ncbi:MAG: aldose epimerase family protein [Gemmatimonadaceae bacterium]
MRGVQREPFGTMPDGELVERFTLTGAGGVRAAVLSYGGVIQSLFAPDRHGAMADVVLGYDTLEQYRGDRSYLGALVGRYANRIRDGRFSLDGHDYTLARNEGTSHLHGGIRGFDKVVWSVEPFEHERGVGLVLGHVSPDGDEGYPGTLIVRVTYTLTDSNALVVEYLATTDAPTPVNLTQHSYFDLRGESGRDILAHEIELAASQFTPVDETLLPTGELRDVRGTPFDFTTPHPIGARIADADEQLRFSGGYDHNFVLDRMDDTSLVLAARVHEPTTGRGVDVFTTEPGIQFYSGNFFDGSFVAKGGRRYPRRSGLALETQHFPDSPNQPSFPSTVLRPGHELRSRTEYHFVVRPS